jgi:hypothetical protein
MFGAGARCSKPDSEHLVGSSEHLTRSFEHLDALLEIAEPVRSRRKAPKDVVEATILRLCDGRYLTLENLADLLNRGKDSLRNHYINPMLESGRLEAKYKNVRTHLLQGYRAMPGTGTNGDRRAGTSGFVGDDARGLLVKGYTISLIRIFRLSRPCSLVSEVRVVPQGAGIKYPSSTETPADIRIYADCQQYR